MNTLEQFVSDNRLHQEFVELINNHSYPNASILDKFRRLGMVIKKTNEEIEGDSVTLYYETKYKGQIYTYRIRGWKIEELSCGS